MNTFYKNRELNDFSDSSFTIDHSNKKSGLTAVVAIIAIVLFTLLVTSV